MEAMAVKTEYKDGISLVENMVFGLLGCSVIPFFFLY